MNAEAFAKASKAAESWVSDLADARYFAEQGELRAAFGLLVGVWNQACGDPTLRLMRDDLAGSEIRIDFVTGPQTYASAHEAIANFSMYLFLIFIGPLRAVENSDEWSNVARRLFREHIDLLTFDVSRWKTRLCSERATLLREYRNSGAAQEPATVASDGSIPASPFSEDFRSGTWLGETYRFTSAQARCVEVLFKAWKRGAPEIGQEWILGEAEVGSKLRDVFGKGKHPAWGKLIVRTSKGLFRLAPPAEK